MSFIFKPEITIGDIVGTAILALSAIAMLYSRRDARKAERSAHKSEAVAAEMKERDHKRLEIEHDVLQLLETDKASKFTSEILAARLRFSEVISPIAFKARITVIAYLEKWEEKGFNTRAEFDDEMKKLRREVIDVHNDLRRFMIWSQAILDTESLTAVVQFRQKVFRIANANNFQKEQYEQFLYDDDDPFDALWKTQRDAMHIEVLDDQLIQQIADLTKQDLPSGRDSTGNAPDGSTL